MRLAQRIGDVLLRSGDGEGIRPVPPERRTLTGSDLAVLWGDLSVGLLVMVTGGLLVPALGLASATLAIVVGATLGCLALALAGVAGQREGVPGMVLFRPSLGMRGSYVPSILNLLQLVGWTAVEFWAMASVANVASREAFGIDAYHGWLIVVALVCTALAIGGPVLVVRRWLERFGIWVLLATTAYLSWRLVVVGDVGALWARPGSGGLPFWLAVDLVIVMPVSWLPLVADYTRFARTDARSLAGTFAGSFVGTAWFYLLGVALVAGVGAAGDVIGIGSAAATVAGGGVLLVALLVGESDNAFANLYSAAVSARNVRPSAPQPLLIVVVGAIAFALASTLTLERYEVFLLLIGSVFVPLAGVLAADYLIVARGRYGEAEVFAAPAWRVRSFIPWVLGFVVYHWCVPTGPAWWVDAVASVFATAGLPFPLLGSALGASIPSFATAAILAAIIRRRRVGAARGT